MNDLDKNKKVDILISSLEERYRSIHTIRDRVQSIGIWSLGIMAVAGGWFIQSKTSLDILEKVLYIVGIVVAIGVLRIKYLGDLERGFRKQQCVAVRLEKALGLFTPGIFDNEDSAVYPTEWEGAGSTKGSGKFFHTTYALLYVGAVFLVITICLSRPSFLSRLPVHRSHLPVYLQGR